MSKKQGGAEYELEHYAALGTIATAAPLMGLLGTVLGMIAAFSTITNWGGESD